MLYTFIGKQILAFARVISLPFYSLSIFRAKERWMCLSATRQSHTEIPQSTSEHANCGTRSNIAVKCWEAELISTAQMCLYWSHSTVSMHRPSMGYLYLVAGHSGSILNNASKRHFELLLCLWHSEYYCWLESDFFLGGAGFFLGGGRNVLCHQQHSDLTC